MDTRLHAVSDIWMKNNQTWVHWKLVNFDNEMINNRESHDKNWGANSPKAAEAMVMLDVSTFIQNHALSRVEGEITMINDNSLSNKEEN